MSIFKKTDSITKHIQWFQDEPGKTVLTVKWNLCKKSKYRMYGIMGNEFKIKEVRTFSDFDSLHSYLLHLQSLWCYIEKDINYDEQQAKLAEYTRKVLLSELGGENQ